MQDSGRSRQNLIMECSAIIAGRLEVRRGNLCARRCTYSKFGSTGYPRISPTTQKRRRYRQTHKNLLVGSMLRLQNFNAGACTYLTSLFFLTVVDGNLSGCPCVFRWITDRFPQKTGAMVILRLSMELPKNNAIRLAV